MQALPFTYQSPQLRLMKKEKAKAMALKLIPSKSFCEVSPQLSVGCISERALCLLLSQQESYHTQKTNLRLSGATAQRYRQKKRPSWIWSSKTIWNCLAKHHWNTIYIRHLCKPLGQVGTPHLWVFPAMSSFSILEICSKKKKKNRIWLSVQHIWMSCCLFKASDYCCGSVWAGGCLKS